MNKIKIVMYSLIIGFISGILSVYGLGVFIIYFGGVFFGIGILLCIRLFFKEKSTTLGHSIGFVIMSTFACFVAIEVYIKLVETSQKSIALLIAGFIGSLILIFSYNNSFKINLTYMQRFLLIACGSILSLTAFMGGTKFFKEGLDTGEITIFFFWQPIMLAAMMYVTIQAEDKQTQIIN